AGAVVLRRGEPDEHGAVLFVNIASDGAQEELITVPDRQSHFTMQGQAVYRQAAASMSHAARDVMATVGWAVEDVDWLSAIRRTSGYSRPSPPASALRRIGL